MNTGYFIGTWLLLLLLAVASCESPKDTGEVSTPLALEELLPGGWEVTYIRVNMPSAGGKADSSAVFEVVEEEWSKVLHNQPMRHYYKVDQTYRVIYRDINGNPMDTIRGMWNTFGDTLMLIEPNATYQYIVRQDTSGATIYRAELDWDGDGTEDDLYESRLRRISKTAE